jgi:integrase
MSGTGITTAHLWKLLDGTPDRHIHDTAMMLSLSGMRFDELRALKVNESRDGIFRVRASEVNRQARREVPVHSALADTMDRLTAGRRANAMLMRDYQRMSPSLRHRFDAQRERVGLPETGCGIESLRPWFVRQAMAAGQASAVIAAVVGVFRDDVLLIPGPSWADLCACVESVTLPTARHQSPHSID